MIKYALKCPGGHAFEAWFTNSAAFDAQAERNLVICPTCGETDVTKAIMAPNVSAETRRRGDAASVREAPSAEASPPGPAAPAPSAHRMPQDTPSAPMTNVPSPEVVEKVVSFMREVRRKVEANAENVGDKFADEARKIHYGEEEDRPIYGEATLQDAEDLAEEGIAVQPLPILPEDRN